MSNFVVENGYVQSKQTADVVSQLTVPMLAQIVLTPMHLLALDIYNRPGEGSGSRASYISSLFKESLGVRMARVGVVYGIAGVGNKFLRTTMREAVGSK